MLFVSLMRWWYGLGWLDQSRLVRGRLDRTADFFSIELVLRTLFKPYRQIDAEGAGRGPLDVILRAFIDQLFSRFFGAIIRTFLIIIGCVALVAEAVIGAARLLLWPVVPLLPLIALPLVSAGWLPWL